MGYTTDFSGAFQLDRELTDAQVEYLLKFSNTRRMKRDPLSLEVLPDPLREKVGLPIGKDAEFYVDDSNMGVLEINYPPSTQPGLWCQWIVGDDNQTICWDGGGKFYNYVEWLEYIIENFLKRWDYTLNGEVGFQGEEFEDRGTIKVVDNAITVVEESELLGDIDALCERYNSDSDYEAKDFAEDIMRINGYR
jgi:hypothetical protein